MLASDRHLPSTVYVDISNTCNLKCRMCQLFAEGSTSWTAMVDSRRKKLMDLDQFKGIIDEVADFAKVICPQGAGEPLLHPRFVQMVEYARERIPDVVIRFNTNGMLLKPDVTDKLLGIGVDEIWFSLDAATRDTYHYIRVGSDWDTVMSNMAYLLSARKRKGLARIPKVSVSYVLQDENEHEKIPFVNKWLPKVDDLVFYKKAEMDGRRSSHFFEVEEGPSPCEYLWQSMTINIDNGIVPCCAADPKAAVAEIGDEPLSSTLDEKLPELWDLHLQGRHNEIEACRTCEAWKERIRREVPDPRWWTRILRHREATIVQNPNSEHWVLKRRGLFSLKQLKLGAHGAVLNVARSVLPAPVRTVIRSMLS